MIPTAAITAWGVRRPWTNRAAIEQDLLLARTVVAIYQHPFLREELAFRGGTCLHQVHLAAPKRYSEDLDFVRRMHAGVGPVLDALREVAEAIGLNVARTDITTTPKLRLRAQAEDDPTLPLRIKVEINTHETATARPLVQLPFRVDSDWYTGDADVLTFQPAELVATKLRALYQRSKGRDLFDLWLALTEMQLDPAAILDCFRPYRPAGYTGATATENLRAKVANPVFRADLDPLVAEWPRDYDIDEAAELLMAEVFTGL